MPQALGTGLGTIDLRSSHNLGNASPGRHAAPGPEPQAFSSVAFTLRLAHTMNQIERIEENRRHGHRPPDPGTTLFQSLEYENPGGKVHPVAG